MQRRRMKTSLVVGIAGFVIGAAVTAQSLDEEVPPRPAWVGPSGGLDMQAFPEWMPVAGAQGEIVGRVKRSDLLAAPPWIPQPGATMGMTRPAGRPAAGEVTEAIPIYDEAGRRIGQLTEEGATISGSGPSPAVGS